MKKVLLSGNEAIARGDLKADVLVDIRLCERVG